MRSTGHRIFICHTLSIGLEIRAYVYTTRIMRSRMNPHPRKSSARETSAFQSSGVPREAQYRSHWICLYFLTCKIISTYLNRKLSFVAWAMQDVCTFKKSRQMKRLVSLLSLVFVSQRAREARWKGDERAWKDVRHARISVVQCASAFRAHIWPMGGKNQSGHRNIDCIAWEKKMKMVQCS